MKSFKAFLLLFLFSLLSCTNTVTIGVNPWPPCEVWYVAKILGIADKHGLEIKIVRYPTWRSNLEAFYEGNTDVVHSSYFNAIYYCNTGNNRGKIAIVSDSILGADGMVTASTIGKIEDLKGNKVGVEVGTDEYFLLYKILKNHGLSLRDIRIISIRSSDAPRYLKSGTVSAVVTYEPYLSEAQKYGRLSETTLNYPDILKDVIMFSHRIAKRRNVSKRLKDVWFETIDWIEESNDNLQYACGLMSASEGMSTKDFLDFFRSFYFFKKGESNTLLREGGRTEGILRDIESFANREGITNNRCNVKELILR